MINNIKNHFFNLMPYGLLVKMRGKRYKASNILKLDPTISNIPQTDSQYKHIVSVQGFGFSGSGAVVDLLREFSNCLVLGSIDSEGSVTKGDRHINGEIDFLRHSGGFFEIERFLDDNNQFFKDALIKRFVRLVNSDAIFRDEKMAFLINQFYNQIIDFEIDTKGHCDYNWHISNNMYPDANIKVMKRFGVDEYRNICRKFLVSFFNLLYKKNYSHLVLDQLCGDMNFDFEKYQSYIPNLKLILVYRDPRDTYSYAIMKDVPWIPHDNVNNFIKWYNINIQKLDLNSKSYLAVRFEDLIFKYKDTTSLIESYLNLMPENHTRPFECLNPEESAKNIALWKNLPKYKQDMGIIYKSLKDYCIVS